VTVRKRRRVGRTTPTSRSPLAEIQAFTIPLSLAEATLDVVQEAGRQGAEVFVLWGAQIRESGAEFRSMIVPEQVAHRTDQGLLVTVEGAALFAVNKSIYERGELLAAQVHSHPTEAYHSTTDDSFSLVTLTGALSIVIPDFGRDRLAAVPRWAIYRLAAGTSWVELSSRDRVAIVDDARGTEWR
jgi:hypothetical protein